MIRLLLSLILLFSLVACFDSGSRRGFSLPVGDAVKGERVFREMQCLACHTLPGVVDETLEKNQGLSIVKLGGDVSRIKTYEELVTSVINPSHKFARGYPLAKIQNGGISKMRNYNDTMTVTELTNLVTFLHPQYELKKHQRTNFSLMP